MAGESETYTKEQVDAMIAERLASEVEGLKKNRDEIAKEAKAAKARLTAYDGIDPEEFKRLKAAAEEAEHKKAAAEGDFSKLKEQMVQRHQQELGTRDKRVAKLESALNRRLTTDELRKALTGKVLPEYAELIVEHGARFLKVQETDDDFDVVITDGKGNALVADGKGSPMTLEQFVDQNLKSKFPGAFAGTGSSGGGATRSTGGASGGSKTIASTNSPEFIASLKGISDGSVTVGS